MPTDRIAERTDERTLQFGGGVLVLVGLHFVVEAAIGRVHAVPGGGPLARGYALVAAVLFVGVGAVLLRRGHLRDRRVEWLIAVLSGAVLVLVAAAHLL